ncbi:MAG TPA: dipeptidase [Planctomycetaceae bacterium]|nr:dipeptidase [Planctomycetaceae bacterium]
MASIEPVDRFLDQNGARFVEELKEFLRIPSVSANPAHKPDMERAAEFVRSQLEQAGASAQIIKTPGYPIVFGETEGSDNGLTALVYGHYDVQPPDPLDEWKSPPFEPTVRDGYVYARGATDDKGQLFTHIKALEAWNKTVGRPPINVKFVIEGEEEVGSNNLDNFLSDHKDLVKCDVAVISDTSQYAPGVPAITYGLRGILACEVVLQGPNRDLHSGIFGGSVANPCNMLARLVAKLHDDKQRVQIPGFYDDVLPLTAKEKQEFAKLPFDEAAFLADLGAPAACGEEGFTTIERRWARPTCDVNGMFGGYSGPGPKTIVPARATAKITCRLVPNQQPEKLLAAIQKFFVANCPPGVRLEFKSQHGATGIVMDAQSPYMQAARKAVADAFGAQPVMIREGGSIPVVTTFRDVLGVDTLLLGWGLNSDNLHSPNERFTLADFHRGTRASAHLWSELAEKH